MALNTRALANLRRPTSTACLKPDLEVTEHSLEELQNHLGGECSICLQARSEVQKLP